MKISGKAGRPLVTAVIPTFERKGFVSEAAASVLSQTHGEVELIVVDDGSTDGTAEHLRREFDDPRLTVVEQENLGVSAARNRGASLARGRFLAFLDSDDLWEPQKIARQLSWLADNPGHRACYTDEKWIRRGKFANPCGHHAKFSGWIFERCLPLCIISPSSILMETTLYRQLGGFDESLPACEDYDLWLRLSARHQVGFVEEKLIVKRNGHEGQLSAAHWGLDRFRLRALWKLALDEEVELDKRLMALEWIEMKSRVVANGSSKRGLVERAEVYLGSCTLASSLRASLAGDDRLF